MIQKIKNKLHSRTGASVSFALLLFLVCAVLCSVIITASSAASGRMSRISESDQRYYAVTSAAGLLQDLIDGKTVSIVTVTETPCKTKYTNGSAGETETDEDNIVSKTYLVADKTAGEIAETDLTDTAKIDVVPADSFPTDAAKTVYNGAAGSDRTLTLTLSSNAPDIDAELLTVLLTEKIDNDGNIVFSISKGSGSSESRRYTIYVTFTADLIETSGTKTEVVSTTAIDENSYYLETSMIETTVKTLTWNLNSISTTP